MNKKQHLHPVRIKQPFYQQGNGCGLHRYLDAEFINRFKQDLQRKQFAQAQFSDWQEDERHSPHGQQPVLRLPLHRAFHLVSCEVCCAQLGHPALDPQKITSAGFVIRKLNENQEQSWIQEDGEAIGWQDTANELRDPDLQRRLCASGVLHQDEVQPSYSGEEVHPLHVLKTTDGEGKIHTLLFGYLPLGGFYYQRDGKTVLSKDVETKVLEAAAESLPWPFGYRDQSRKKSNPEDRLPIDQGRPTKAFFELLQQLANRYHLGESKVSGNSALEKYCGQLGLYDISRIPSELRYTDISGVNLELLSKFRKTDLFSYLQDCFSEREDNPLIRWLIEQEQKAEVAGGLDKLTRLDKLPNSSGKGTLDLSLFLLDADGEEIRNLMGQRLRQQTLLQTQEIPLPKFTQGPTDLYQVIPFVRSLNAQGREQIQWAESETRSIPFRVAAPFDPEASRPSLIQMPPLSDLKRGLAKGAAMITPADSFKLIKSLKLSKGVSPDTLPDEEPGPGVGVQWICSFSLPVITLVAMILLMVMISLLNILFFWLPWVRICLPFPKGK